MTNNPGAGFPNVARWYESVSSVVAARFVGCMISFWKFAYIVACLFGIRLICSFVSLVYGVVETLVFCLFIGLVLSLQC